MHKKTKSFFIKDFFSGLQSEIHAVDYMRVDIRVACLLKLVAFYVDIADFNTDNTQAQ